MKHKKLLSLLIAICMMLSLVPVIASAETTKITDELNLSFTGRPANTSYDVWSGKTGNSGTVYAGQSAGGNGAIQIRSNNSNSGIVTTASVGNARKIVVAWNSNTSSGRTLNVYGKNTPYSQATDLYSSTNQGTLLGTIVMGTGVELTITGDYAYIGMRSASGAMWIDTIDIEWEINSETPPAPIYTVTLDPGAADGEPVTVEGVSSPYTLPACPFTAPEGQEFDCWKVNGDETEYAAGSTYELSGDTTFYAQYKDLPVIHYTDMMLKRVPANGDTVVIYYPTARKVMTGTDYFYNNSKHELAAADATLTDNVLAVPDEAVRLTVQVNADGGYSFKTADNTYLYADGTDVQFVSEQGANTLFRLETAAAGTDNYYIRCDSASYNGKAQYIEYYNGYFSVYGFQNGKENIYTFQFFSEDGEGPTPEVFYTVTLYPGDAEGEPVTVEQAVNPFALPACPYTAPEGYLFDGWKRNGDERCYAPGEIAELTEDTAFYAQWKELIFTNMTLKRVPQNGDTVVIYNPDGQVVLSTRDYFYNNQRHELAPLPATLTNGVLAVPDGAALLTVEINEDVYSFRTSDGRYLYIDGSDVRFAEEQGENTLFLLEPQGDDSYYIKCNTATYNGSAQYLQYYHDYFTCYGIGTNTERYLMNFYSPDNVETFTVYLDPGEADGEPIVLENVASPYTLPGICPFDAPAGCIFDCWTVSEPAASYAAGETVEITEDTVFVATWKALEGRTYVLVTSEEELTEGGTYLIASELFTDELYLMSRQTTNNRAQYAYRNADGQTVTLDNSWIAASAEDELAFEFTLVAGEDGWAFYDALTGGYLYAASNSANWLRTEETLEANGVFRIVYEGTDGATVPVAQGDHTRNHMHYNGGSKLFSCYAESTSVSGAVYLYKLVDDTPETLTDGFYLIGPDWTVDSIEAANMFGENLNAGGEYLLAATLTAGDQIKVVKVENGAITAWYPDGIGTQYTVDTAHAGDVTIYFRQTYNSAWSEFGGYFYIATDYAIECVSGEHGLVSTAAGRASAGTTVTVYVEAEEDYELDTLTVLCGEREIETTKVTDEQYTFEMPAGDVTVTATFKEIGAEPREPAFMTQSLLLEGKIGVNFYLDLPAIDGVDYADSYMTFTITGNGTVNERDEYDADCMNAAGIYYGFTCYVGSMQMADTITATFHYGDGLTIEKEYAVKEYFAAYDENKSLFDTETQTLIESTADFGHYVQAFLAAQRGLTLGEDYAEMDKFYTNAYDIDTVKAAVADCEIERTHSDPDLKAKVSFSVKLDSATTICLYFTPVKGYTGSFTAALDGEAYTATKDGSRYVVEIPNIAAHEISKVFEVVVTTDNGSATVRASVLSYVKLMLDSYTDALSQNAAAAIWAYAAAADACKNAH